MAKAQEKSILKEEKDVFITIIFCIGSYHYMISVNNQSISNEFKLYYCVILSYVVSGT